VTDSTEVGNPCSSKSSTVATWFGIKDWSLWGLEEEAVRGCKGTYSGVVVGRHFRGKRKSSRTNVII
jgi:hypothetical protein